MKICLIIRSNKGGNVNNFFDVNTIKEASIKNGHEFFLLDPKDIVFSFKGDELFIKTINGSDILDFDAYILRINIIKDKYKKQTDKFTISQYLRSHNKFVFNYAETIRASSRSKIYDFYRLNKFKIPLIPTLYVESSKFESTKKFLEKSEIKYPLILKSNKGLQGKNLFKVENESELKDILENKKSVSFLLQPYFKILHDLRVLVLGGVVLGAMDKIHSEDNFKGNISQGALGKVFDLSLELKDLAIRAARADGSDFVGVDIAITDNGIFVLEVNRSPGFEGFSKYLNIDVASKIIEFLENKVSEE